MKLFETGAQALVWDLDFFPAKPWPLILPVIAVIIEDKLTVVAGFERRNLDKLTVLTVDSPVPDALAQFWPDDTLGPLERLRLQVTLGRSVPMDFLLNWPLELQKFLDKCDLGLKSLKPMEFLSEWNHEISEALLKLTPTSSQVREIIDLLCDLKISENHLWPDLAPGSESGPGTVLNSWIARLRVLRNPKTTLSDKVASDNLSQVSWPRGIRARWERTGDQAGLLIQTKVTNHTEWLRLKASVQKLEIGESLWPRFP